MKLAYIALSNVAALAIGFGGGWHAKGVSVTAGQSKTVVAQSNTMVTDVNKQAAAQHANQVVEQGKTIALNDQLDGIHNYGMQLQQEIQHAVFIPYAVPGKPVVQSCPDPVATPDFMRLYNAAAAGNPTAAAATGAGGMYFVGLSKLPARPDAAAWDRRRLVAARP